MSACERLYGKEDEMKIGSAKVSLPTAGLTRLDLEMYCILKLSSILILLFMHGKSALSASIEK